MGEFIFDIRVSPGASRNSVGGQAGNPPRLVVQVQAPPEDGKANEATIRALAKAFDLKSKDIEIISGETYRDKRVKVTGDVIAIQKMHLSLLNSDK